MFVDSQNGFLLTDNGVYQTSNGGMTNIDHFDPTIPSLPILFQNYPNPFNSTTTFSFYLEQKDRVFLSIYNVLGTKVMTLVDSTVMPGMHKSTICILTNAPKRRTFNWIEKRGREV